MKVHKLKEYGVTQLDRRLTRYERQLSLKLLPSRNSTNQNAAVSWNRFSMYLQYRNPAIVSPTITIGGGALVPRASFAIVVLWE